MENKIDLPTALADKIDTMKSELARLATESQDTKQMIALVTEIERFTRAHAKMVKAGRGDEPSEEELAQMEADKETLRNHVRANILSQSDYYYVHEIEKFLLYNDSQNEWIPVSERGMANHYPGLVKGSDYWNAFMDVLKQDGRWFLGRTSSLNPTPDKLNMMRLQLLEPVAGTPHPLFDLVIRSVCGDKPENIAHLERVIVAKYNNPGNFLLPVICLADGGGTGKSLLTARIMSTLFGARAVASNVRMSDFAGQFNGHLCGKLVVMINENCEETYNHNRMKMIAGSPVMDFTFKNQTTFEGENTALIIVTGNSVAGSIRVDGGDVDRRFSVIRGTQKLSLYTAPWLRQELNQPALSTAEAEDWIVTTGQKILTDPGEVSVWLHALLQRHGNLQTEPALHGSDYRDSVAVQKPLYTLVFEAFFATGRFTYVNRKHVYDFYVSECRLQRNRATLGKTKFYLAAEKWLHDNMDHIITVKANWGLSTADVYCDNQLIGSKSKPTLTPNDSEYFYREDNGRVEWKVSI